MPQPRLSASSQAMPVTMSLTSTNETSVLVLQGGGALGAYQAGTYEALVQHGRSVEWVAGISIGAINAALIAGNPQERRVERLREFWDLVSSDLTAMPPLPGEQVRGVFNELSAAWIALVGVPGFFAPRVPPAVLYPPGAPEALSLYDSSALRATLERLIDFDRINAGHVRLSVGAVNVRSGNFVYFDNRNERIGPEHIMASAALPPGLPPITIDGEHYWDGGLVSNTPLDYVLDCERQRDLVIFQVDLFPAHGPMPRTLLEVSARVKDIRFSSRTRLNTDKNVEIRKVKQAVRRLIDKLPPDLVLDEDVAYLRQTSRESFITLMQLIYRQKSYESESKDYEFSRTTMLEHWEAGRNDLIRSFRHRAWHERRHDESGIAVFDLAEHARD